MKLSEKIYTCRKKAGLSQEALAEKLGVSRQAVSKWETGEAIPELTKIPIMAKIFGVTADFLLSEEEHYEEEKTEAAAHETPNERTYEAQSVNTFEKIFKKFSWLLGVYVALAGGGLALLSGFVFIFSVDITGAGIFDPFYIIDGIVFLAGIAVLITGIWLAIHLKKKSK